MTTPSQNQINKSIQICHLLLRFRFPFLVYMQTFMNSFCPIQFCLKIKPCMYFFGLNRCPFWWYVCFPNGMYVFRLLDFQYDVPQHPLFLQGDDLSSNGWNVFHLFSLNNASRYFTFWNVWKSFVIRICSLHLVVFFLHFRFLFIREKSKARTYKLRQSTANIEMKPKF